MMRAHTHTHCTHTHKHTHKHTHTHTLTNSPSFHGVLRSGLTGAALTVTLCFLSPMASVSAAVEGQMPAPPTSHLVRGHGAAYAGETGRQLDRAAMAPPVYYASDSSRPPRYDVIDNRSRSAYDIIDNSSQPAYDVIDSSHTPPRQGGGDRLRCAYAVLPIL